MSISSDISSSNSSFGFGEKRVRSHISGSTNSQEGAKRQRLDDLDDGIGSKIVNSTKRLMFFLDDYKKTFAFLGQDHPWSRLLGSTNDLIELIRRCDDDPFNEVVSKFACRDPMKITEVLIDREIDLPTYADVDKDPKYRSLLPDPFEDYPAKDLRYILELRDEILDFGKELYISQLAVWHIKQQSENPIFCHIPASNRPPFPLQIMHPAFYKFTTNTIFPDSSLPKFRKAAFNLAECLTYPGYPADPEMATAIRASMVMNILTPIFPIATGFEWIFDFPGQTEGRIFLKYKRSFPANGHRVADIIVIDIKLEEGDDGDAFMQSAYAFDSTVEDNPSFRRTGAPTFLITMSGPNIKFCGGWAHAYTCSSVDVFQTHFACLDVALDHVERLARSLYSLKSAIDLLPLSHTRDDELGITVEIPHIFENYQSFDNMGAHLNLQIIRPLKGDRHFSVFEAQAWGIPSDVYPGGEMQEGNCVAKLVYGPYGEDVHKALAPKFAPKLFGISSKPGINAKVYIVEYMPPPKGKQGGWSTLSSLDPVLPRGRLEDIRTVLDQITQLLKSHEFVHGDLHPDNLMIKLESQTIIARPVEIKILNFELAGVAGTARYPLDHADRATDLIGVDDGSNMTDKWVHELQSRFWFGPSSAGVGVEPSSVSVYYPSLSRGPMEEPGMYESPFL